MANYDVVGNVVIVKFRQEDKLKDKKKFAEDFLKKHKSVRTVLEKVGGFSGRLRTQVTKFIAGEKTKEVLYKENGCEFRFNVDTCYFSPRLSTDRLEVSGMIKKGENVLVMFGGVGPYAVVIGKQSKAEKVVSVELGREPTKYAKENIKRNKLQGKVEAVGGDVRRRVPELKERFDRIVMARPNLKDSFLDVAFRVLKKGGIIHYHGFYPEAERGEMIEMIKVEAKRARKKIKILRVKKAGEIGTKKYRYRVDLKVSLFIEADEPNTYLPGSLSNLAVWAASNSHCNLFLISGV
ncbi:MAG: class I SAM-dependent methyltransferase family protein [Nanoarchaeota archaeon]|nr:class I SAM-dependent methyltransferase family protein [Nanoarchaeota archaeon]